MVDNNNFSFSASQEQEVPMLPSCNTAKDLLSEPHINYGPGGTPQKLRSSAQEENEDSGHKNQLLLSTQSASEGEKKTRAHTAVTTAYNSNAPSTFDEDSDYAQDEDDETAERREADEAGLLTDFWWKGLTWPEQDVLDLPVTQYGKTIRLRAYRWPAEGDRKAVVFMLHGYGSFMEQMAIIAKYLAAAGYEVLSVDQRGFGHSDGGRGIVEDPNDVYSDQWLLIHESLRKFKINAQKVPIFLFGRSFGGLLATNMASTLVGESMFAGVCLLTPYYRLFTERLYESRALLQTVSKVRPNHKVPCEYDEPSEEYLRDYGAAIRDKRFVTFFTATTALLWIREQEAASAAMSQIKAPMCFIEAENDGVVRNDYCQAYFERTTNPLNEYHHVAEADHTNIVFHHGYASKMIKASIAFFDKVIAARKQKTQ